MITRTRTRILLVDHDDKHRRHKVEELARRRECVMVQWLPTDPSRRPRAFREIKTPTIIDVWEAEEAVEGENEPRVHPATTEDQGRLLGASQTARRTNYEAQLEAMGRRPAASMAPMQRVVVDEVEDPLDLGWLIGG